MSATATHRQWTAAERRAKRAEYARLYQTGHGRKGHSVTVPADVVVLTEHAPCGFCGQARGPCQHRKWA